MQWKYAVPSLEYTIQVHEKVLYYLCLMHQTDIYTEN